MTVILQHPNAPVHFDPLPAVTPHTDPHVAAAITACAAERAALQAELLADVRARYEARMDLLTMVDLWGLETVKHWLAGIEDIGGRSA